MTNSLKHYLLMTFLISILTACNQNVKSTASNNVLIKEWEGPYGGVPAFDKMKVEDIKDAMIQGMKLRLIEIENIAKSITVRIEGATQGSGVLYKKDELF